MFKPGDKVRKSRGDRFSNDEYVATVEKVDTYMGQERIWLKETGTHINGGSLVLDYSKPDLNTAIEVLKEKRDFHKEQAEKFQKAIDLLL